MSKKNLFDYEITDNFVYYYSVLIDIDSLYYYNTNKLKFIHTIFRINLNLLAVKYFNTKKKAYHV